LTWKVLVDRTVRLALQAGDGCGGVLGVDTPSCTTTPGIRKSSQKKEKRMMTKTTTTKTLRVFLMLPAAGRGLGEEKLSLRQAQ
jgi:hypothetical protein